MITVTINRTVSGLVKSFTISGHAGFADRGEDIVCAGVSAVSIGAINAIEMLTHIELIVDLREDGYLHCQIPDSLENSTEEKIQLLLEGMFISLQTIQLEYGKHVEIKINQ